jgi:hypothetical protein
MRGKLAIHGLVELGFNLDDAQLYHELASHTPNGHQSKTPQLHLKSVKFSDMEVSGLCSSKLSFL